MSEIGEFLLARYDEDEAVAREALSYDFEGEDDSREYWVCDEYRHVACSASSVLTECRAKRSILESVEAITGGEKTYAERLKHTRAEDAAYVIASDILRHLASVYSDHPDYDPAWA